jgi:sulfite exporter TauE/SafE
MNLIVAFLTGLTTGGLGCLAIQGGLLASTLAYQVEQDLQVHSETGSSQKFKPHIAQPIILFLLAKLIAYTALGFLLGALGSALQLTPLLSAILYFAIGIFMIGNGLRMLNVHPIFRYFVITPPSSLTRYIRRKSKNGASLFTPLLLGTLTIFLPCGVTQAMMAAALATGSPLQGGVLMFAFILGTSPIFFSVAYFATRLGATVEKYFNRIVAVTMLLLGLVQVNAGLNLVGSPVSFSTIKRQSPLKAVLPSRSQRMGTPL